MSTGAVPAVLTALLAAACAGALPSGEPASSGVAAEPVVVPMCSDMAQISAPPEAYRDAPVYVGNEMPVDEVQVWAEGRPAYEDIWIDREHNGWITVAFSADAAARQAEIDAQFSGAGVVAVAVPWTTRELEDLQQRVHEELPFVGSSGRMPNYGVVSIGLGVLTADRLAAVEAAFGGERVCVEGIPPEAAPPPGPQPLAGDGWRLVGDEKTGPAYRTWIASDQASLVELWREAQISGPIPDIDFEREVAIWFGAVYGSSCPNIRLDDVVIHDRVLIHAEVVNVDVPGICTADANGHAYVVAVERARLPAPPFRIQLSGDDPPGVLLEARTEVDADLRVPGAVAAPGQVRAGQGPQDPWVAEPGGTIETGIATPVRLSVHCGVEWLGELNSVQWRTTVPAGAVDFVPPEWEPLVVAEAIVVSVLLSEGPAPTLTATANGHSIEYRPTHEEPPGCD